MLGVRVETDEATGTVSVGPMPPVNRIHKGKSQLIFPVDYVVIDIETTGLDPRFDEIIEIAGIKYHDDIEVERFQSLVKPEDEIDPFITELTGITNDMVENAPNIASVLPDFLSFVGSDPIVGHNVNFDVNFIYDYAEALELPPFSNDFIDTMRISRRLYKDMQNHKLSTLVSYLGVGDTVEHRALSDCIKTQQCFAIMKTNAEQIGGTPKASRERSNSLSKTIAPETTDFDLDNPIYGMAFAFTGKLERMTRKEAMQAVANAGGICCDGVTAVTNYLVLGNNDYCKAIKGGKSAKQKKAEKMQLAGADIKTISEEVFYEMLNPLSEQITLTGFEPLDYHEKLFPDSIMDQMGAAVAANGVPADLLKYKSTKSEQITLTGSEPLDYHEKLFLDSIMDQMRAAVAANGVPADLLKYKSTKADAKTSKRYTAVFLLNFTSFRLKLSGKTHYICIPTVFEEFIPEGTPKKVYKSESKYIRIPVDQDHPLEGYVDFLVRIAGETVNRYPKEWDCCSRYMKCSDAKSCVHPDKAFALACGYRRILASGRIFYGKNRNID